MTKPFIQDLVNDMTLEEKLAQLTQLGPHYWGLDEFNRSIQGTEH